MTKNNYYHNYYLMYLIILLLYLAKTHSQLTKIDEEQKYEFI